MGRSRRPWSSSPATCGVLTTRPGRWPTPSVWNAAPARWRAWGGWWRPRSSTGPARANGRSLTGTTSGLTDHDVLLTPVTPAPAPRLGSWEGRGWLWTSTLASAIVPYCVPWNFTGQPACSVPAGFDAEGLPRSVQLVGRPNDEATLLSLAAQIEAERPWAQDRPPGFS